MDDPHFGRRPAASERKRLDVLLVERGLFPSRARAQAAVLAGHVFIDGRRAQKAGEAVAAGAQIQVRGDPLPYAGRGGLKLAHALDAFGMDVSGRTAVDVGASTGGFTDVLLQRGARRVYAVDVGYGQLAWRLRNDPRVVVMDRTNARRLTPGMFAEPPDLATVDVSFISVAKILPALAAVLEPPGDVVVLVKPQFEAGREQVGKGGIVRDRGVHLTVMLDLARAAVDQGFAVRDMTHSPVPGGSGNLEFFQWWRLAAGTAAWDAKIQEAAERAVTAGWELVRQGTKPE
ncbi:MAG TPA: TlyA family RNA methyltransferase [Bacillota bacterium]